MVLYLSALDAVLKATGRPALVADVEMAHAAGVAAKFSAARISEWQKKHWRDTGLGVHTSYKVQEQISHCRRLRFVKIESFNSRAWLDPSGRRQEDLGT